MKRAVIVHCWDGSPEYAWYPWLKTELEKAGYEVSVPSMPLSDEPQLSKWLPFLQQTIGQPDEDLILIGHSIGCATIMRYLESLADDQQVGRVIMVAGFTDQLGFKELENFFEAPLTFEKIKTKSANGFVAIQSDNDPFVSNQYGNRLEDELGAKLVVKQGAFHMSGSIDDEESCVELPELLDELTD